MDALLLARWQFGITTVYHFFFVLLTIGLSLLTAGLQTAGPRTGREHYSPGKSGSLVSHRQGVTSGTMRQRR